MSAHNKDKESKLPEGWEFYKLKSIAQFIDYRGKTPKKTASGIPLITAKNVRFGYINEEPKEYISFENYKTWMTRGFPSKGDLIFTTEAPLGYVAELNFDSDIALAQRVIVFKPKGNNYDSRFLKYQLLNTEFQKLLNDSATGTTVKGIKASILKELEVKLPPLPEQQRIVQQLDTLFERIDKAIALTQANLAQSAQLLPAALNEVFGKAEEKGWKKIPVFDVLSLNKKTVTPELDKEYNIIGLENIEKDSGKLVEFKSLLGKESISSKVVFEKQMILYGKLRPYLNKVWVAEFDGIATTEILPFKANLKRVVPSYVAYYFRSGEFLNKVNENCSGARMPRLTTKFWDDAFIPVSDLATQENTVTYLNQLSAQQQQLQRHYTQQLQQLQALKASLLDSAFRGEL